MLVRSKPEKGCNRPVETLCSNIFWDCVRLVSSFPFSSIRHQYLLNITSTTYIKHPSCHQVRHYSFRPIQSHSPRLRHLHEKYAPKLVKNPSWLILSSPEQHAKQQTKLHPGAAFIHLFDFILIWKPITEFKKVFNMKTHNADSKKNIATAPFRAR